LNEILDGGADPNVRDDLGNTPLMLIASQGKVEATKILIERGALVNASNDSNKSALTLAKEHAACSKIVLMLEQAQDEETRRTRAAGEERHRQREIRQQQQQQQQQQGLRTAGQDVGAVAAPGLWGPNTQTQLGDWALTGGMGFFPSLFALQFQAFPRLTPHRRARPGTPAAQEEAEQMLLSRVLIVLSFIVFTCLFIF